MTTADNKIHLLRNIRDAFIATDDTGLCDIVMAGEDFTKVFQAKVADERIRLKHERLCRPSTSRGLGMSNIAEDDDHIVVTQFDPYPDLEDSDEDDLLCSSYIRYDEMGGHRQRSNTSQWLDKKREALLRAANMHVIRWEDMVLLPTEEIAANFAKMDIKKPPKRSMLTELLENCPELPHMQYIEYAKFDGTAQLGFQTKMFKIFMKISEKYHNYPIVVCVLANARIKDVIGFACYKYSIAHPDIGLGNIDEYGLCIAEDDGDVDLAFPCLEATDPCGKFGFTCLGLIELSQRNNVNNMTSSLPDGSLNGFGGFMFPKADPGPSYQTPSRHNTGGSATSVTVKNALLAASEGLKKGARDPERMHAQKMASEAPQYKTYRVYMLRRVRFNTLIQLGVSGEKMEVEPITTNRHTFWLKPKYFTHSIDCIVWCQLLEVKNTKTVFRVVYTEEQKASNNDKNVVFNYNNTYKYHDFECEHKIAKEIVDKVNTLLELRNSPCRREYKTAKQKKLQSRTGFYSKYASSSRY